MLHRYWYERVMVDFRVAPDRLQTHLPPDLRVSERYGASNLTVSFCSVRMDQQPDGTPRHPSRYLYVVLNGPAVAVIDGRPVHVRYLIYTDHPEAYAGCSVIGVRGTHEQHRPAANSDLVTDHYVFVDDRRRLELELSYRADPGVGSRSTEEGYLVRCAADVRPHAERYRNDEFHHWIRRSDGTDRADAFRITVATPELSDLFDGSEQLVSVHAVPMSVREVSAAVVEA